MIVKARFRKVYRQEDSQKRVKEEYVIYVQGSLVVVQQHRVSESTSLRPKGYQQ